ncbi:GYD domain-containing protein [Natronorarus salvus]|uniref:GYD domain-containing protein n=1 Tax=Natronorarus salvus TaxID=3117733 RepID=UPI002F2621AF
MAEYLVQVNLDQHVQNAQELAGLWGDLREKLEEFEVEVVRSYAVLGDVDFVLIIDAPDRDAAAQAAITIGSYGFTTETNELIPVEEFAGLVGDF